MHRCVKSTTDVNQVPVRRTHFRWIDHTSLCLLREISRRLGLDPRQKAFKFPWGSDFKISETRGILFCPPMKPPEVFLMNL